MNMRKNVSLARHTTMRVGGPARFFIEAKTIEDVNNAVLFSRENNVPLFVLGSGSNIVVRDTGFDGVVLKMNIKGTKFFPEGDGAVIAALGAGEGWDAFVARAVRKKLYGVENLSFIPGTVGAAPIQNIGAYGMEVEETVQWVTVFDQETLQIKKLTNAECGFSYRESVFKKDTNLIVTEVAFLLRKNGTIRAEYKDIKKYFEEREILNPSLEDVRAAVIAIRKAKLPDPRVIGTVGSFFKNPIIPLDKFLDLKHEHPDLPRYEAGDGRVKIPLGWVLDSICKLKGIRRENIGTHESQALVLVHYGGATAREIEAFAEGMRAMVQEKIGIVPEYEISFVGKF